uniref:Uncharacterized protein n=1 Tax=uncultured marine virus TaxID=186617 RepID=A0A0F7L3V6_9VIRU|nr:hypothetical protein [uncultured marine virus]
MASMASSGLRVPRRRSSRAWSRCSARCAACSGTTARSGSTWAIATALLHPGSAAPMQWVRVA